MTNTLFSYGVKRSMFYSCYSSLCFSPRKRHRTLALTYQQPTKESVARPSKKCFNGPQLGRSPQCADH